MCAKPLTDILQVAKEIMLENNMTMHVRDIAEIAIKQNKNLGLDTETLVQRLSSALAQHVKTKDPIFVKPTNSDGSYRKGVYRLKRTAKKPVVSIQENNLPSDVSTNFSGKAGEYAVASEFLFRGYNVSMMAVDEGIDLITEKDGTFKYVQVKTSVSYEPTDAFAFKIPEKQFKNNSASDPFYVFVMRDTKQTAYAVIPSWLLKHWRLQKKIAGNDLSINITRDPKCTSYKLNNEDINAYISAFDINQQLKESC